METYNTIPSNPQIIQSPHPDDTVDTKEIRCNLWCPKRYFLAIMLFLGSFCMFSLRTNLSIAIIEMTKNRTMEVAGQIVQYEPEFRWDSKVQGLVLSAFSYGFMFTILGSFVVKKFGGITAYGCALLSAGLINIMNPSLVRFNFNLFLVARVLEGLFDSLAYVSISEIWSRWAPAKERSKLVSFGFTGQYFGTTFNFPLCGYLAHIWGWPVTFYFTGGMAAITASILLISFGNQPRLDKCITKKELDYLNQEMGNSSRQEVSYRWKLIFTNKPLWALFSAKFAYGCGFSFISICIPLYIKDVLGGKIHDIGILSGVPNMASIFTIPMAGYAADYIQNKNTLNATQVHKMYILIGLVFGSVCLFAISSISNFTINLIILILLKIMISLDYLTIQLIPIYLSPNHASMVAGITSYGYIFGVLVTPLMIGYVVVSHDAYQWSICLISVAVVMLVASLIFALFGSSEPQNLFHTRNPRSKEDKHNTETLL